MHGKAPEAVPKYSHCTPTFAAFAVLLNAVPALHPVEHVVLPGEV